MAILEIVRFPDPRLRQVCTAVDTVNADITRLVEDMWETMYAEKGVGLAAIQVNVIKRILVTDVSREETEPLCFINPEIVQTSGEVETQEGCLSVPGFYAMVKRHEKITVNALDQFGKPFSREADGLLAVCIQHEIDHLNGKLFVDYLSPLKRGRIRKKLEKQQRLERSTA